MCKPPRRRRRKAADIAGCPASADQLAVLDPLGAVRRPGAPCGWPRIHCKCPRTTPPGCRLRTPEMCVQILIQEPAVVRNDHRAARKAHDALLQRAQRAHVNVVGRLVQQQHIRLRLERHGQVQAVALAARQHATFLLLSLTRQN